jgi:hypothetical protein
MGFAAPSQPRNERLQRRAIASSFLTIKSRAGFGARPIDALRGSFTRVGKTREGVERLKARSAIVQPAKAPDSSARVAVDRKSVPFRVVIDPNRFFIVDVGIVRDQDLVSRTFRPGIDDD